MRQYEVRDVDMTMALCDRNGEAVVELDSACMHPSILFALKTSAEDAARVLNESGDYPAAEFVAAAIETE